MGNCIAISSRRPALIEYKDTTPFVPPVTAGTVIKVYDGDTITIASTLPIRDKQKTLYRFSIRLRDIDSPELRTSGAEEKEVAQLAQKTLSELCLGQRVTLQDVATEKYGRILAQVILQPVNINLSQYMLQQRLAVSYVGGTKVSPVSWKNYHENGTLT